MSFRKILRGHIAIFCPALTLGIFGTFGIIQYDSLWGINHLRFLPVPFEIAFYAISTLILSILLIPKFEGAAGKLIKGIDKLLWSSSKTASMVISLSLTIPFFFFRVKAPLLGDAGTWLAIFGQGPSYILKWAEPGSILLLRAIQSLLGGYSRETAMTAFQIISIASGVVFTHNIITIIGMICETATGRFFALVTVLSSGAMLLFFGYIEFYPTVWAVTSLFLNFAVRYLKSGRNLWLVLLIYIVCILLHFQTLILLPGVVFLLFLRAKSKSWRQFFIYFLGFGVIGGAILLSWLIGTRIELQLLLLPIFRGRPPATDYSLFSLVHLIDLANLTLLVFPGAIAVAAVWILYARKKFDDAILRFLILSSAGSLLFLILFGAAITMARDWDIMSLALLSPILLILYQVDRARPQISGRFYLSYTLCCGLITVCFLSTAIMLKPSENRFDTLLNARNEPGWIIYANYFLEKGDQSKFREIMTRRSRLFPNLQRLQLAYDLLEKGQYEKAMKISQDLINKDPNNSNYLQILGNLYGKFNQYDSAEEYYDKALRLQPYSSTLMNEIGQLYIKEKKFDEAISILKKAHSLSPDRTFITESMALTYIGKQDYLHATELADTLLISDTNSPGAHLIRMVVAVAADSLQAARYHYAEFLKYGGKRSDYTRIKEYYRFLGN